MDATTIAAIMLGYFVLAFYATAMRWLYLRTRRKLSELQTQLKAEGLESKRTSHHSQQEGEDCPKKRSGKGEKGG